MLADLLLQSGTGVVDQKVYAAFFFKNGIDSRLHRILISSGILYCASAAMMFIPDTGNNWMGFLLAGVVVQMYASWMIDKEMQKSEK